MTRKHFPLKCYTITAFLNVYDFTITVPCYLSVIFSKKYGTNLFFYQFETSTEEFHELPDDYIHHAQATVDTRLKINLLQEYVFIPLDIFRQNLYNRGMETPLDVWLTFLSVDDPEWIVKLIQQHPEFKPLYKEVYAICRNVERTMGIFSEELRILDRNTVQLMIDKQIINIG